MIPADLTAAHVIAARRELFARSSRSVLRALGDFSEAAPLVERMASGALTPKDRQLLANAADLISLVARLDANDGPARL